MQPCKSYKPLLFKLINGGITEKEQDQLREHCKVCPECRQFLTIHEKLKHSSELFKEPAGEDLLTMRREVIRRIKYGAQKNEPSMITKFILLFKRPVIAYAFSVIMLISGFFTGRQLINQPGQGRSDFIQEINFIAEKNTNFTEMEKSPFIFSDVNVKNMDENQISLSFNVTRHLDITRLKNDPLVKEVLAQSIINPQPTGYLLRSIAYAENIIDPKIKDALLYTLQNDESLPVRLKTLTVLMNYQKDDQIQEAFFNILRHEESVQMRLMVIDYLTQNEIDKNLLEKELGAATTRNNTAVLIKAREYFKTKK